MRIVGYCVVEDFGGSVVVVVSLSLVGDRERHPEGVEPVDCPRPCW